MWYDMVTSLLKQQFQIDAQWQHTEAVTSFEAVANATQVKTQVPAPGKKSAIVFNVPCVSFDDCQ